MVRPLKYRRLDNTGDKYGPINGKVRQRQNNARKGTRRQGKTRKDKIGQGKISQNKAGQPRKGNGSKTR